MNEHDSEILAGVLERMGYDPVADVCRYYSLNTCCVRETAENKVFSYWGGYVAESEKSGTDYRRMCMPQQKAYPKNPSPFPHVILFSALTIFTALSISPGSPGQGPVVEICHPRVLRKACRLKGKRSVPGNIMYGCNNYCTYCMCLRQAGKEAADQ